MKFSTIITPAFYAAIALAAPPAQPFAIVTRIDGTSSWVGGSVGCFGTVGKIRSVKVTDGYRATFYAGYSCGGAVLGTARGEATFVPPIDTKSVDLKQV